MTREFSCGTGGIQFGIKMASKDVSQVIATKLKCYLCGFGPRAGKLHRWYRCHSSQCHQICENCAPSLMAKRCRCGKVISSGHCKLTQALLNLETMRFNCFNQSRGCQETSGEEAMILHEQECTYRLVECLAVTCEAKVPFHELAQHMKDNEDHGYSKQFSISKGKKQIHETSMPMRCFDEGFDFFPVRFDFDGRIFYR